MCNSGKPIKTYKNATEFFCSMMIRRFVMMWPTNGTIAQRECRERLLRTFVADHVCRIVRVWQLSTNLRVWGLANAWRSRVTIDIIPSSWTELRAVFPEAWIAWLTAHPMMILQGLTWWRKIWLVDHSCTEYTAGVDLVEDTQEIRRWPGEEIYFWLTTHARKIHQRLTWNICSD